MIRCQQQTEEDGHEHDRHVRRSKGESWAGCGPGRRVLLRCREHHLSIGERQAGPRGVWAGAAADRRPLGGDEERRAAAQTAAHLLDRVPAEAGESGPVRTFLSKTYEGNGGKFSISPLSDSPVLMFFAT